MTLEDVKARPGVFLGPGLSAAFVEALETGVVVNQFLTFYAHWSRERFIIKFMAVFVTAVAIMQTSAAFWNIWHIYIQNFGDWAVALDYAWPDKFQSIINVLMAAPSQVFFLWRCWRLTNKSYLLLIPSCLLLIGTLVSSAIVCAKIYNFNFAAITLTYMKIGSTPVVLNIEFIFSLALSAVLDIFITLILFYKISRGRSNVISRRFKKVLNRFLYLVWASALPPSLCAIVTVITYLVAIARPIYFLDLCFLAILGKLYVISLFVMLNGREDLRREELGISLTPASCANDFTDIVTTNHVDNTQRTPSQVINTFSINLTTEKDSDGQISEVPSTPC